MARPDRDRAALIVFCAVCMALATVAAYYWVSASNKIKTARSQDTSVN